MKLVLLHDGDPPHRELFVNPNAVLYIEPIKNGLACIIRFVSGQSLITQEPFAIVQKAIEV